MTASMTFTDFSNQYMSLIETKLKSYAEFHHSDQRLILQDAIQHSLLSGGKRIRPLLCLASQQLFSNDPSPILAFACATEIIHTYSLIHDDLPSMDDDHLRRGKPTCHVAYGEDIAILAGDTLNTLAFEILANDLPFSANLILKSFQYFSKALGINGLVGGQILDIKPDATRYSIEYLKQLHSMKTGALIQSCLVVPAILNQASSNQIKCLETFGYHLGLLFQIVDDILDVTGDSALLGKTPLKDEKLNKLTYVHLLGLDQAKKEAQQEAQHAKAILDSLNLSNTSWLQVFIDYILNRNC